MRNMADPKNQTVKGTTEKEKKLVERGKEGKELGGFFSGIGGGTTTGFDVV
jgi:hypothetical protein